MLLDEDLEVCSGARKGSGCGLLEYVVAIRTSWTAWYCEGFWSFLRSLCTLLWTSWTAWHCEGSWKKKKERSHSLSLSAAVPRGAYPVGQPCAPLTLFSAAAPSHKISGLGSLLPLVSVCFPFPSLLGFLGAPVTETGTARIWQRGRHTPSCYLANSA